VGPQELVEWEAFRACWVAAVGSWLDGKVEDRPPGTAGRLAWRLWAAVHGIAVVDLAGHDSPSGDAEYEVDAVVRLLLQDPPHAARPWRPSVRGGLVRRAVRAHSCAGPEGRGAWPPWEGHDSNLVSR